MAKPCLPEERLAITRTGSIGSWVGPAVTMTCLPASGPGPPQRLLDRREDRLGLGQAPRPIFAARHLALVGLEDRHAVGAQPRDVAPGRLVLPHPHVHRRRGEHRLVGGEQQGGGEIVGDPRRHLRQQVGGRRADHDQVGLAAELDMAHLDLVLEVPQAGMDRLLGQRRQRHRRDELRAALGQHAAHAAARLADQPDQLARLVGGDAAADDEEDALAPHGARLRSQPPPRQRRAAASRATASAMSDEQRP